VLGKLHQKKEGEKKTGGRTKGWGKKKESDVSARKISSRVKKKENLEGKRGEGKEWGCAEKKKKKISAGKARDGDEKKRVTYTARDSPTYQKGIQPLGGKKGGGLFHREKKGNREATASNPRHEREKRKGGAVLEGAHLLLGKKKIDAWVDPSQRARKKRRRSNISPRVLYFRRGNGTKGKGKEMKGSGG